MAAFHVARSAGGDDDNPSDPMAGMASVFGPGHVDQCIRQAIQMCWMSLPADRQTVDEVEKQIRRLTERALTNIREDHDAFGRPGGV